tara:strand:+ start:18487 stop:18933 length:447 start_codon:yes stop_codon:yes gene_type:complete
MKYDINHIKKHLPHRSPFLFVDEIVNVSLGDSIHAKLNLKGDEDFFQGHFPGNPVMPGVIIIESLAQAAGVLGFMTMEKTPEEGSIYYFAGVDNVRFRHPVYPGNILELHASIKNVKNGIWKFQCYAEVEDKTICTADILCADRSKSL